MTTPSKQRGQVYAALLALMMLGLALACAQVGVKAWQQTGSASAWPSLVAAPLLVVGAVALLYYAVRSVRASLKNMPRRESRTASETSQSETLPRPSAVPAPSDAARADSRPRRRGPLRPTR